MNVIVFAGPTVSKSDVRSVLAADVRPPARRGDLLLAARTRPDAIGLIDGRFDGVPAVWHKEILWAMAQGIHVLGAASMGALRAAELHSFGMEGIGEIFTAYKNGELVADDEVAVAHGNEEEAYRAFTDPLVNIRATLQRAKDAKVISAATVDALISHERKQFYAERSFAQLLSFAEQSSLPNSEVDALRSWLPSGKVDQKRLDALELLDWIASRGGDGWVRMTVAYSFSYTDAWEALWRDVTMISVVGPSNTQQQKDDLALLDELAVSGDVESARLGATARVLALEAARRSSLRVTGRSVAQTGDDFRRERSLLSGEQFSQWAENNGITETDIDSFFTREATIRRVHAEFDADLVPHLLDHLRTTGDYARLRARIAERDGAASPPAAMPSRHRHKTIPDDVLWRWYFVESLKLSEVPADLDAYAAQRFTTLTRLRDRVLREFRYRRDEDTHNEEAPEPATTATASWRR